MVARSTNQTSQAPWLPLKFRGARGNRSAIGPEVCYHAGGRQVVRTVSSSVGCASSSDLTVHSGLGESARASVEIRWPSGKVQKLVDIAANQRLNIAEPARSAPPLGAA
jgi:hypothetical protein